MNLNLICSALVVLLCLAPALRSRRLPRYEVLVFSILAVGYTVFPLVNGFVALAVWLGLRGIPSSLAGGLVTATVYGDYRRAAHHGRFLRYLHPEREWRARGWVACGLAALAGGESAPGERYLARGGHAVPALRPFIELQRGALVGDWRAVLTGFDGAIRGVPHDVTPSLLHLQALGEVGDLESLDRRFIALEEILGGEARTMARLLLGVFHGEVEFVRYLLDSRRTLIPTDLQRYWIATALERAGRFSEAVELYGALKQSGVLGVSAAAYRRSAAPAPPAPPIPQELRHYVSFTVEDEARFGDEDRTVGPVTTVLLWLIGGVYVVEHVFGNGELLFNLGAFWPFGILTQHEWWRVVTPLFLHVGIAHVAFNALALRSLAPFVERSLGSWRFLLVYLGSGSGGLLLMLAGIVFLGFEERIVVGASGSIMGLVGATGAILHRATLREGSSVARERLRAVGAIIGLQIVFDLLVPQTSGTAHLLGALLGYLLGRIVIR